MSLEATIAAIGPLDTGAMRIAAARQDRLTKPRGALGRLEQLGIQLAGITGRERPRLERPAIVVAAASHGIAAEGVSAYPASVTAQMLANFVAGGAAINVLARHVGAKLLVVDAGVDPEVAAHPLLRRERLAPGTASFLHGPAMPREHARSIVERGIAIAAELAHDGVGLLAVGEMGIGNTTSAAALVAAATGAPAATVTGRGTGVDDATLAHKRLVVERAVALHRPDPQDGLALLSSLGGYEIGLLAGCILGAAARRVPVLLDGYITAAAALVAVRCCRRASGYLIAAHRSAEAGHALALADLGLDPLLDLGLRLGEGSGAALALPLVVAAARLLDEMATFDEAGVDDGL